MIRGMIRDDRGHEKKMRRDEKEWGVEGGVGEDGWGGMIWGVLKDEVGWGENEEG